MEGNKENPIDIEINELKPSGEDELPILDSLDMSDYEPEPVIDMEADPLDSASSKNELPVIEEDTVEESPVMEEKKGDEKGEEEQPIMEEEIMEETEFIIDDYEVIEDAVFELREILDLPENRIIATDEEQERELREDLIRNLSEKQKTPETIQAINKTIKRFSKLKYDYSTLLDGEISGHKEKGVEYKPLLQQIKDGNFKDSILNPVLFGKKILHETEGEEGPILSEIDVDNSENIVVPDIKETVDVINDIHEKYKRGPERNNYNLQKETREILDLTPSVEYGETDNGYKLSLTDKTRALVNPYEKTKVYVGNEQLNVRGFIDDILFPGIDGIVSYNPFTIQGLLRKEPRQEVFYRYAPLFQVLHHSDQMKFIDDLPPRVVLNESFELEDTINVCLPVQDEIVTIPGKIIDITEDHYEIEPLRKGDKELYKTLKIALKDEKLMITKNTLLQKRDENDTCLVFEDTIFQFPDKPINSFEFEQFLEQIIPSHKTIFYVNYPVLKSAQTLEELEMLLLKFGSNTKQLTQESMRIARKFLDYNNELQKNIYQTEYNAFRKNYKEPIPKTEKDKDMNLLSRKLLSSYIEVYDEYPDYGKPSDSAMNRLRWLLSRSDKGLYFYKLNALNTIQKNRTELFYQLGMLKSKLDVIKPRHERARKEVEKIKENIINSKAGKCPEKRIVKRYKTYEDMDYDTNKEIFVDKDLLLFYEKKTPTLVKEGQYAILETVNGNEIWKRENIQGSIMWTKTDEIDGGHLINSNLDFCNNQGKTLEMLEKIHFDDPKRCIYSKVLEVCVNKDDFKKLKNYHNTREEIESLNNQIDFLNDNQDVSEKLKKDIDIQEFKAIEYLKYVAKLTALREKETKDILDDPEKDELYRPIYQKIDAFKKEIHKLPIEKQYPKYQELIQKWSRPAKEDENPRNLYVKVGKKVLFCKHHEHFIKFYDKKNKSTQKQIYDNLVREYGVPVNGFVVCNNCGQEIGLDEFETVEGFTQSGAYQTTTEVLEEDQIEKTDNELKKQLEYVSILESILSDTNKKKKVNTETTADIVSIVREYQTLMGIRFKENTHISLIKQIHADLDIIKFNDWVSSLPSKIVSKTPASILKKKYNMIVNIESILSITASFILLCQTSNPIPLITKAHKSCKLTFMGYPLTDKSNDNAVSTFVCILENLRNSNSPIWSSLRKVKLREKIHEKLNKLLEKDIYTKLVSEKKLALEKELDDKVKITHAEWNEFRPPLKTLTVRESSINKKTLKKGEKDYLYSLKTMEYIDSVIRSENATSTLYEPVPLGQSCCHQTLEPGFSVLKYFDKDSSNLVSKNMKEISDVNFHGEKRIHPTYSFPFETRKELLDRFDKNIFAEGEELSDVAIQEFFIRINTDEMDPHFGEPLLFVDGVCIRSGKIKDEIVNTRYTYADYQRVIERIHKKQLFNVASNKTIPKPFIDVLQDICKENTILGNRPEIKKLISGLKGNKNKKEIFETLKIQTEVLIEEITNILPVESFSVNKKKELELILSKLALHTNTYTESLLSMNDEFAKATQFTKGKYSLYNFIATFIPSILCITKTISAPPGIPPEDFKSHLFQHLRHEQIMKQSANVLFKTNCSYNEQMKKSIGPSQYNNMIFEVIDFLKPYEKLSYSIKDHPNFELQYMLELFNMVTLFKKPFEELSAYPTILDLQKQEIHKDQITPEQMFILCKFITIVFILSLINRESTQKVNLDLIGEEATNEPSTITTEDGNTERDNTLEMIASLTNERTSFIGHLFYDMLDYYNKHLDKLDFYTTKIMKLELAKDYDTKKNKNLKFYEDLDKESRKSLQALIQCGIESYKRDLSEARNYLLHDKHAPISEIEQEEYEQYETNIDTPILTDEQRRIQEEGDFLPDDE